MTIELKPCPFCGSSAEIERYGNPQQSTIYTCTSCGCRLETGEEWDHGRLWNAREPVTPEWQPIESAPRDGTRIDVWCRDVDDPSSKGWRECAATWDSQVFGGGAWVAGRGAVHRLEWMGVKATHWMPIPGSPRE